MKKGLVLFLVLLIGCQDNEADAPELLTIEAQQIASTGVVMGCEIKEVGPIRPINYGFLWDKQPDLSMVAAANKYIGGNTTDPRTFSIQLNNLTASTKYYYRGFAANADYSKIYYGNVVSFTTLP
ncbi:MAG TPA: fibronectin type III domain-containing protein [Cyclobacteriaceae bacterium]|nr:fibronectin type III domain-containing protein [Cyclobacteriaceae bacterium]